MGRDRKGRDRVNRRKEKGEIRGLERQHEIQRLGDRVLNSEPGRSQSYFAIFGLKDTLGFFLPYFGNKNNNKSTLE